MISILQSDFVLGLAMLAAMAATFLAAVLSRSAAGARLKAKLPNRRVAKIRALNWSARNYIWVFITLGGSLILAALLLYVHQLPGLIRSTVRGLEAVFAEQPRAPDDNAAERIRNLAYAFAALAGALTIMATIPFQLIRVWLNERSARTAEQGHITDQINKAVEGLGAEKEVNRLARNVSYETDAGSVNYFEWQDEPRDLPEDVRGLYTGDWTNFAVTLPNIEVRMGAIYALERISQDSPRDHIQIMEILTAYIRENSPADSAKPFTDPGPGRYTGELMLDWDPLPDDADEAAREAHAEARRERFGDSFSDSKAWRWAQTLKARTDIQAALRVLGRRNADQLALERADTRYGDEGYRLDLRATNLQAVDISGLDFRKALFLRTRLEGAFLGKARLERALLGETRMRGANLHQAQLGGANLCRVQMEGAYLSGARMKGANLSEARMEGANLSEARMEGANLGRARLERAHLHGARMEGADLTGARFDRSTVLRAATNGASALKSVDFTNVDVSEDFLTSAFGDASVTLPDGYKAGEGVLSHWSPEKLDVVEFLTRWRAWQTAIGYKPRD